VFAAIPAVGVLFLAVGFLPAHTPQPYSFPDLRYFPVMPVNPGNPVTVEGAELGRYLFYDPILSRDSSFSCASCHKQEFAFSDGGKQFSTGIEGAAMSRNTPPLFNLAWYRNFFWDGSAASLEEQVFQPVSAHDEMNLDWEEAERRISSSAIYRKLFSRAFGEKKIDSVRIAMAIAQFERTLISHNSKYDQAIRGEAFFTKDEAEGFEIVNDQTRGDCLHCHTTDADPLGTTGNFSNNGLDEYDDPLGYKDAGRGKVNGKSEDFGKFRIPSLRNVALTGPYMHDGRFQTLEEVINFYSEGVHVTANVDSKMEFAYRGGAQLTVEEKRKAIAFLRTLTDENFVRNPEFGKPLTSRQSPPNPSGK